jgi:hypothetical protein
VTRFGAGAGAANAVRDAASNPATRAVKRKSSMGRFCLIDFRAVSNPRIESSYLAIRANIHPVLYFNHWDLFDLLFRVSKREEI